jgi:Arc/MetJ-type ribon-helix-helix transcriptional regulator
VTAIVEACVDDGAAPSAAAFVEEAVRYYADSLYNDDEAMIAAAEEGIAAIERGEYVTIATQANRDALSQRVWARARELAEQMRLSEGSAVIGARAAE